MYFHIYTDVDSSGNSRENTPERTKVLKKSAKRNLSIESPKKGNS